MGRVLTSIILGCSLTLILGACATSSSIKGEGESNEDIKTAIGSIVEAVSNKDLSDEEKDKLTDQILGDKDAQEAIKAISDSMDIRSASVKYCPITGKRYASHMDVCPLHAVKLSVVQ